MAVIRWQRDENTFARRIVHSDLKGFLSRGFIIDQGTRALFFEDGALREEVRAGKVESGGILRRLLTMDFSRVEAVVCEAGDIGLVYMFGGTNQESGKFFSPIHTADGSLVQVGLELAFRLKDPAMFVVNVLKGKEILEIPTLKHRYFGEMKDALKEFISRYKIDELSSSRDFKNLCCDQLEKHLHPSLVRDGFELLLVRSLCVYNPDVAALNRQRMEMETKGAKQRLIFEEKERELADREKWRQLRRKERKQDIDEKIERQRDDLEENVATDKLAIDRQGHDLEHYQAQTELWQKLREAKNRERMDSVSSQEELAEFLDEVDSKKVMREEQKRALLEQFSERREDHQRARAFANARVDMEHEYALKAQRIAANRDIEQSTLEFELNQERKRVEGCLAIEEKRLAKELEMEKVKQIERLEARDREQMADLTSRKRELEFDGDKARSQAEVAEIITQMQENRAQSALRIKEKQMAIKRVDHYEQQKMELEIEQGKLELELKQKRAQLEDAVALRGQDRADMRVEHERVRLQGEIEVKTASINAERDVAVVRAQSDAIARKEVLAEKERQLEMQRQGQEAQLMQSERNADRMERLADRALASAERIAAGTPTAPVQSAPAVVSPTPAASGPLRICTGCGTQVKPGVKHCANCGNQLE